jgi:hypothetical protein
VAAAGESALAEGPAMSPHVLSRGGCAPGLHSGVNPAASLR